MKDLELISFKKKNKGMQVLLENILISCWIFLGIVQCTLWASKLIEIEG